MVREYPKQMSGTCPLPSTPLKSFLSSYLMDQEEAKV